MVEGVCIVSVLRQLFLRNLTHLGLSERGCRTCTSSCRLTWLKSSPSCDSLHKKHPLQTSVPLAPVHQPSYRRVMKDPLGDSLRGDKSNYWVRKARFGNRVFDLL